MISEHQPQICQEERGQTSIKLSLYSTLTSMSLALVNQERCLSLTNATQESADFTSHSMDVKVPVIIWRLVHNTPSSEPPMTSSLFSQTQHAGVSTKRNPVPVGSTAEPTMESMWNSWTTWYAAWLQQKTTTIARQETKASQEQTTSHRQHSLFSLQLSFYFNELTYSI